MERVYTIFAGVNGAGKTTLYRTNQKEAAGQNRVNSDEILRENKGDWRNNRDQIQAMKEAAGRVKQYLDKGVSFNQETTLTGN
ncbi:MAG: AAA family ATPase, partial [Acetatifactor sp.]|nr:AAA family ATPase [Acetatifactor sp.]